MDVKIFTDNIEGQALNQIYTLAKLDAFADSKIRIMPDVHAGAGCVIGFTADLGNRVIPNIVGVDIGCSMLTIKLKEKDIDLERLDKIIHDKIPSGHNIHEHIVGHFNYKKLLCIDKLKNKDIIEPSIGSLGGGNHFVEVDKDNDENLYLVIHTGSRNLGKQVAEHYQKIAENRFSEKAQMKDVIADEIQKLKESHQENLIEQKINEIKINFHALPKVPRELSWLENSDRDAYLHDMRLCQEYSKLNRKTIADIILSEYGLHEESRFETMHNYIGDDNIVRKGAISTYKDERVLIPLNMRDGCIIGIGKGNPEWNYSGPHGAGRVLSRSKAKEQINLEDYKDSMSGIFTTCVNTSTIDESPMAYKPSEEIISLVKDTVNIERIIKPIYNFKASE